MASVGGDLAIGSRPQKGHIREGWRILPSSRDVFIALLHSILGVAMVPTESSVNTGATRDQEP